MIRVFVYGTLKRGQPNHYLMEDKSNGDATFLGEGKTVKKYPLVIASKCNIPFLLPVEGQGEVIYANKNSTTKIIHGDVFEVDKHMLERLDELECHPIWYRREEVDIEVNNDIASLWCYFLEHHRPELLALDHFGNFDFHSLPDDRKYILPAMRGKTAAEREREFFGVLASVKLPEFYLTHKDYISHNFKDK